MAVAMTPLSIEITSREGSSYKSIREVRWIDIPGFAILTGPNGSGKTQLLELIAYQLTGARPPGTRFGQKLPVDVIIDGSQYDASEVGYVPSVGRFQGSSASSLSHIPSIRQQAFSLAQQRPESYFHDVSQTIKSHRAKKLLSGVALTPENQGRLNELFPDDLPFAIDDIDVTIGIAHVFVSHRFKLLEALERGTPGVDKDGKEIGPAPWDVVNESLKIAGFPYRAVSPNHTKLADNYIFMLEDTISGAKIQPHDLSSGEKILLQLVLWLFTASKDGLFPKILLLDEPDAHLHPSMTSQFLSVIHEVLVERYGVRVILTTHSPSTVALAPRDTVFQMERGGRQILRVSDRAEAVSVLTAGLVTVSSATKYCFVEDVDDVRFYETLYEILTDRGPSRDRSALRLAPSIAFIAASVGSGPSKISGGCDIVRKWVGKLDAEPLTRIFLGIIDRDTNNQGTPRIFTIGRYSFENYLLDPINIFCTILIHSGANPVPDVSITTGDEHLIRTTSNEELQRIIDFVCTAMQVQNPALVSGTAQSVEFTTGQAVSVPQWVIDHRGHDLLPIAQKAFGHVVITPPNLYKSWRRTRLVPIELAKMLAAVQCV